MKSSELRVRNSHSIHNLAELRSEVRRLEHDIRVQEMELRSNLKALPSEAVKVGAGAVMPSLLKGKTAALALTAGAAIAGGIFARKRKGALAAAATTVATGAGGWKVAGITALAQLAFKLLANRSKKKNPVK